MISQNKLYAGSQDNFKFQEDRPEIKAWTNLITMKDIPVNKREVERLATFQAIDLDKQKKKKTAKD